MRIAAAAGLLLVLCGCTPAPAPNVSTPVGPRSGDATTPPTQTRPAARSQSAPTVTPAPNAPTATPGGPAAFASLRGLVRQITGAPAQNIAVELRPEIPTDASDPPRASTRTGQDGRYALERIANGRYLLSAGGGGAGSPQANVTVAGVDQTLDLEIEPVARALVWLQLTGRVVDANERGVPGARLGKPAASAMPRPPPTGRTVSSSSATPVARDASWTRPPRIGPASCSRRRAHPSRRSA